MSSAAPHPGWGSTRLPRRRAYRGTAAEVDRDCVDFGSLRRSSARRRVASSTGRRVASSSERRVASSRCGKPLRPGVANDRAGDAAGGAARAPGGRIALAADAERRFRRARARLGVRRARRRGRRTSRPPFADSLRPASPARTSPRRTSSRRPRSAEADTPSVNTLVFDGTAMHGSSTDAASSTGSGPSGRVVIGDGGAARAFLEASARRAHVLPARRLASATPRTPIWS